MAEVDRAEAERRVLDQLDAVVQRVGLREDDRMTLEYIADIRADAMNTEGSFTIFLFDGDDAKDDADSWDEHQSLMATHSFFTGPEKKGEGIMANSG